MRISNMVLTILAVSGAVALVGVLGMWLMQAGMMIGGMSTVGCGIGGLLLLGLIFVAIALLWTQRKPVR